MQLKKWKRKKLPKSHKVLDSLDKDQRAAFVKLWQRVPPHLHERNFCFEKELWKVTDNDALADCFV